MQAIQNVCSFQEHQHIWHWNVTIRKTSYGKAVLQDFLCVGNIKAGTEISNNFPGAKRAGWFEILVACTKILGPYVFKLAKLKQSEVVYSLKRSHQFIVIHIPFQFYVRVTSLHLRVEKFFLVHSPSYLMKTIHQTGNFGHKT